MQTASAPREILIVRQVFETWWIGIPPSFEETFVAEGSYWHAWDRRRSVSLTSTTVRDGNGPVTADAILAAMPPLPAPLVDGLPVGLAGWAAIIDTEGGARASRATSGILAVDGRVLLVTITADDLEWARGIWLTIGHREAPRPSRRERRDRHARRPDARMM